MELAYNLIKNKFNLDIRSKTRKREFVEARCVFIHYTRLGGFKFQQIGAFLNLNHASIIYQTRQFEYLIKQSKLMQDIDSEIRHLFIDDECNDAVKKLQKLVDCQ